MLSQPLTGEQPLIGVGARRFGLALGMLVAAMIAIVYLGAAWYGIRPARHPASGLFWIIVAAILLRAALRRPPVPVPIWVCYWYGGLVVCGLVLWVAATIALIRP